MHVRIISEHVERVSKGSKRALIDLILTFDIELFESLTLILNIWHCHFWNSDIWHWAFWNVDIWHWIPSIRALLLGGCHYGCQNSCHWKLIDLSQPVMQSLILHSQLTLLFAMPGYLSLYKTQFTLFVIAHVLCAMCQMLKRVG